jgi:archaemetzincin
MSSITVVPLEFHEQEHLSGLVAALERTFHWPVTVRGLAVDPARAFDGGREQYNSTVLLGLLLQPPPPGRERVLGVTSLDLFIPILTFVFGEAQLDGQAALVSTCRLKNETYGIEGRRGQLLERLQKEAIHELGHTFGLTHCGRPECVMRSATYVEQIDVKTGGFCLPCREYLHDVMSGRDGAAP